MWRWDTREVPAAESGRVYGSLEERCGACEVNGGDEPPCISADRMRWWQQERGRPCPRVEIDPRNAEAFLMIGWLIHDDLKPLAELYARELLRTFPAEDRGRLLSRVATALRSPEMGARLHPQAEDRG